MNKASSATCPQRSRQHPVLASGVKIERDSFTSRQELRAHQFAGSHEVPDGEYLYDPSRTKSNTVGARHRRRQSSRSASPPDGHRHQWNSQSASPVASCADGSRSVIAVEILGVRSLAFATGSYLSIATTGAMFCRRTRPRGCRSPTKKEDESEASPGAFYSSGLIAPAASSASSASLSNLLQDPEISTRVPHG